MVAIVDLAGIKFLLLKKNVEVFTEQANIKQIKKNKKLITKAS